LRGGVVAFKNFQHHSEPQGRVGRDVVVVIARRRLIRRHGLALTPLS